MRAREGKQTKQEDRLCEKGENFSQHIDICRKCLYAIGGGVRKKMPEILDKKPDKPVSISRKQSYFVAKGNDLIQQSRFSLTMQQNKIMLFLISKIKPHDIGNEMYSISIREFCKVCNIECDSGKNYSDVKNALKTLADKSVWVKIDGNDTLLRWLNRLRVNRETGHIELSFHPDMIPFLYDLQSRYTSYSLENVLTMRSKYGIRLYELLKSYEYLKKEISFSLDELKERLDAPYKRYPDFRRYVLEPAIDDINNCSDIEVGYIPYQSSNSRSIDMIIFSIEEPRTIDAIMRSRRKSRALSATAKENDKKRRKAEKQE